MTQSAQSPNPGVPAWRTPAIVGGVLVLAAFGVHTQTEVDRAVSELYCRSNFVVDSYEVIGRDEDFPVH